MPGTIYGTVYDNVTKAVITTATVVAPPYVVSNNQGAYTFMTPGASNVDVTASAPGYTSKKRNVTVANGQIKKVDFFLVPIV